MYGVLRTVKFSDKKLPVKRHVLVKLPAHTLVQVRNYLPKRSNIPQLPIAQKHKLCATIRTVKSCLLLQPAILAATFIYEVTDT